MGDLALYAMMGLALVAAFVAQALLLAAREHVRAHHPDWYRELGAGGSVMRIGGPDDRARRRLIRPLLWGPAPPAALADAALMRLAQRLRLAFLTLAAGFGGVVLAVTLRVQGVL